MTEGTDMQDREGLAAEYVLGTLPLADRLQAERLLASDPAFGVLVHEWQMRLSPLDRDYAKIPPPPDLIGRIESRLFPELTTGPARRGWSLFGALAATLSVVVLAFYLSLRSAEPELVATLVGENQPLVVAAAFDADRGELTLTRTAGPLAGEGKDYEMWVIPAGGAAISVGLLRDQQLRVPLKDLPAGTTLAITLEQQGGSPTGQAQGPILVATVIEG